ncbi:phage head closure protein [Symbiopectobacterium purcellii]|uniref:phage head closure protein n=1 Tax=Symbiopectobacterium purcellii TaxID=2871826 RepID=UPI003F850F82
MLAGRLRHRVTLRRVAIERSPLSGAEQHRAQEVASVWCQVEPISNRKIRTADQQRVVNTVLFTLRPRTDVEVDWQVVWQGRVLTVTATDRSQRDRLVLRAEGDGRHDRV